MVLLLHTVALATKLPSTIPALHPHHLHHLHQHQDQEEPFLTGTTVMLPLIVALQVDLLAVWHQLMSGLERQLVELVDTVRLELLRLDLLL